MSPRARRSSLAANPVLIGAATVLIAIVAVVLAYNANSGLPFVKTYDISAQVPDAAGIIVGNDVRKGGSRVGDVSAVKPIQNADGQYGAILTLKLDESVKPLPVDSQVEIRPKSVLGLKYVQLTAGRSKQMLAAGATIPLRYAAAKPVELDDLFNMFTEPTRKAAADNTDEFGDALAGRGNDLNRTIQGLTPLLQHADPVLRNLLRPDTEFARFFPALEQAAAQVAPVAQDQAGLVTGLNQTFTALAGVRQSLMDSITYGAQALQTGTTEFPKQAAFMNASTELFRRLRPAFASLSHASPGLAAAFVAGTPALKRAPALNQRVATTLAKTQTFGNDPRVLSGLGQLAATSKILQPTVHFIAPAQSVCNYITLLLRNLSSALSESTSIGSSLQAVPILGPPVANSESGPSAIPADGPAKTNATGIGVPQDNYLHSNPYPNTDAPGQPAECEAGNEQYVPGRQVIGNTPRNDGLITEGQKVGSGK